MDGGIIKNNKEQKVSNMWRLLQLNIINFGTEIRLEIDRNSSPDWKTWTHIVAISIKFDQYILLQYRKFLTIDFKENL